MPYIKQEARPQYETDIRDIISKLLCLKDENDAYGHLNYVISSIMKSYIENKGLKYHRLNGLIGSLECAKLEMYRMLAAPYEDIAQKKNGHI